MPTDNKRLLLEFEKTLRDINREAINPVIQDLHLDDLKPVMKLAAKARAAYLKSLFKVAGKAGDGMPSPDQIKKLRFMRLTYEELVAGATAVETAIERGYLDVKAVD